jgi:hypothetical protein
MVMPAPLVEAVIACETAAELGRGAKEERAEKAAADAETQSAIARVFMINTVLYSRRRRRVEESRWL